MPTDELIKEVSLSPPIHGLLEGKDPTLPNQEYPPTFAPEMANNRTSGGKWETRLGTLLWQTLPGSGRVRGLWNLYTSTGQRIRLAARGDGTAAIFYDLLEGTDTSFNAASGGTGLGGTVEPRFHGAVINDIFYFTDRFGVLRKYQRSPSSGNKVRPVALPVKPSAAPGVKARIYEILEPWPSTAPYGWTVSNSAKFDISDGSGTLTSPIGGPTILLDTKTNPNNSPITEDVTAESIPSNTIGVMVWNSNLPSQIAFQIGIGAAAEFNFSMDAPSKQTWTALLFNVGSIGTINFKRFNVTENNGAADAYISRLLLPGRLQGSYRYIYTHYDPTLKRESDPSDISNGGVPTDVSAFSGTAAFQKSIAVNFTSDSGSDSTTTKIRIYRSGGQPSLTKLNGIDVFYRVGEVFDQSTTASGAGNTAGSTTLTVASATNIAVGDWLVIEKGTVSKEEYVRVTSIAGAPALTISQGLQYAHTAGVAVQMAFVDNVPNEQVDTSTRIFTERDDPPSGTLYVARSPDGRLWLFGPQTHVYVSNRATPDRPTDYEVFAIGIDPITRQDPLQGFDFEVGGDVNDETITWGGFFNDRPYVMTRRFMYAINATSQVNFNSYAVTKQHSVGCVCGDTVAEVNGWLYWVSDGGRVFRWDGQGGPEDISHLTVNVRLAAAPPELWKYWFAMAHRTADGTNYSLFFAPEADLDAPTNLVATAVSTTEIDLTWTDNATDESGFEIQISTDNVNFTSLATVGENVTSYAATGLTPATLYYFRVRAFAGVFP